MLKIAITGNIAAGKSEAEKLLSRDFSVYDADKIAHKILGDIDRQKLGRIVFSDVEARKKLEEYVHPKVKDEISAIFSKHQNDSPIKSEIIFVSVPLLFEAGFEGLFDKILFIACDEKIRLERLMRRNNLTEDEALQRINAQAPQDEKILKSDYVIYNNSSLKELERQISDFVQKIKECV